MCSRPMEKDGNTFACRTCNECVAARRNSWVGRAMMERATAPFTYAVTLTYADDTEFQRDGARFFRYSDVRLWLANIRRAVEYHHPELSSAVRFIACGEQGDLRGRCHWHVILFSHVDLRTIGSYEGPSGPVDLADIVTEYGGKAKRRRWSLWPHGFVVVQQPDEEGIKYALTYALKDAFTVEKSQGTMRENRVEKYATGYFRMSKTPPLGSDFIDEVIYRAYTTGDLPYQLRIDVPDSEHYYYPSGTLRNRLLVGLRRVNQSFQLQHGQSCAGWSTLLHFCKDNESDMEVLTYDEKEQWQLAQEAAGEFARSIDLANRETAARQQTREIRHRCGAALPCVECLRGLPDEIVWSYGVRWNRDAQLEAFTPEGQGLIDGVGKTRHQKTGNPHCQLAETASRKAVFSQSASPRAFTTGAR